LSKLASCDPQEGRIFVSPQDKKLLRRLVQENQTNRFAAELGGTAVHIEAQHQRIMEKFEIRCRGRAL
jgi:hypothetical protein